MLATVRIGNWLLVCTRARTAGRRSLIGQAVSVAPNFRRRRKPDWFVWKLLTLAGFAAASAIVIGATDLIVGGNYDRAISAAVLIVGIVGASLFWKYFRSPIDPEA